MFMQSRSRPMSAQSSACPRLAYTRPLNLSTPSEHLSPPQSPPSHLKPLQVHPESSKCPARSHFQKPIKRAPVALQALRQLFPYTYGPKASIAVLDTLATENAPQVLGCAVEVRPERHTYSVYQRLSKGTHTKYIRLSVGRTVDMVLPASLNREPSVLTTVCISVCSTVPPSGIQDGYPEVTHRYSRKDTSIMSVGMMWFLTLLYLVLSAVSVAVSGQIVV